MAKKSKNPQNYRTDRTDRLDRPTARPTEPTDGRPVIRNYGVYGYEYETTPGLATVAPAFQLEIQNWLYYTPGQN